MRVPFAKVLSILNDPGWAWPVGKGEVKSDPASPCPVCGVTSRTVAQRYWKRFGDDLVPYLRYRCERHECAKVVRRNATSTTVRTTWEVLA